jgi:DUF4097 and DUF4098 domain-containing protein YvlB
MTRPSLRTLTLCVVLVAGLPAAAGSRIERELALAPGGTFLLDTDAGSVTLAGTSESNVRVVITSKVDDVESRFDFRFDELPGRVEVHAAKKGTKLFSWFGWGDGGLRYEVRVPSDTDIEIQTSGGSIEVQTLQGQARLDTSGGSIRAAKVGGALEISTSGGSISIEDAEAGANAETSGGGITVERVRGNLHAETSGGSITIEDVTGDVDAQTSGGSIRITQAGGRVSAETSGGSVTCAFRSGNARGGDLSTSGGGIQVSLDPSIGLEIDAQTSGGSVTADLPVTRAGETDRSNLRGKVGAGGAMLRLRSSGGPIRIEKGGPE